MDNLFSGLESMGLGKMKDLDIFDDGKKEEKKVEAKAAGPVKVDESTLILEKTVKCPVCDIEFKEKFVKTGKARLVSQDIDLRPKYADIDAHKYDVIACPVCGYAALARYFATIGSPQAKLVKEKISMSFTGFGEEKTIYSYDDAIGRLRLALVNAVVKRSKVSERAYICLLIGWMLRGKAETLPEETPDREKVLKALKEEEMGFLNKACEGLMDSFSKESFPLVGLDEPSATYLIAALCAETGKQEEALRWVSRLIVSKSANDRIKERARNLKEMVTAGEI